MQTLDQDRAKYAWEKVQNQSGDYRNLVKSAPAIVMSNGLMQTMAFLESKGKNHHIALSKHITGWLMKRGLAPENHKFDAVMQCLHDMEALDYQRATEEALAILRWLRQLVDAVRDRSAGL